MVGGGKYPPLSAESGMAGGASARWPESTLNSANTTTAMTMM